VETLNKNSIPEQRRIRTIGAALAEVGITKEKVS
jgi:hypothetical protein